VSICFAEHFIASQANVSFRPRSRKLFARPLFLPYCSIQLWTFLWARFRTRVTDGVCSVDVIDLAMCRHGRPVRHAARLTKRHD
jgi:hypothetical protein